MKTIFAATAVAALALAGAAWAGAAWAGSGPPTTAAQQDANKKLVTDFWREVLDAHDAARAAKYYAPDMKQHNPNVSQGLAGFQKDFGANPNWKTPLPVKPTLSNPPVEIIAEGDLVMMMRKTDRPDPVNAGKTYEQWSFDVFRVENGMITEHWDSATKNPPPLAK